jgi:hypothetical protein
MADNLLNMWKKGIGGWRGESTRHSLSAKGVKTGRKAELSVGSSSYIGSSMKRSMKKSEPFNKVFDGVGVDSGMIVVADASKIEKDKYSALIQSVPNGNYKIKVTVYDTWNGTVKTEGILKVTSGEMVVTDPSYIIDKDWKGYLGKVYTDWNAKKFKGIKNKKFLNTEGITIADNMGGDGEYKVRVESKRL